MTSIKQTIQFFTERDTEKTVKDVSHIQYSLVGHLTRVAKQKSKIFLELTDGSCPETLKCIYFIKEVELTEGLTKLIKEAGEGDSVRLKGKFALAPKHATQAVELVIEDAEILDMVRDRATFDYGSSAYKRRSAEETMTRLTALRSKTFTRFADPVQASLMRVRGFVKSYLVSFFDEEGFVPFDPPIITASDCEGAGEMFTVTTLPLEKVPLDPRHRAEFLPDGSEVTSVDYYKDFFGEKVGLTVSGQLEAEAGARALGKVYTFGPTFRAEHSATSRHLAEFWMLEPEMVFDQEDEADRFQALMDLEESMIKETVHHLLKRYLDEMEYIDSVTGGKLIEKLSLIIDDEEEFERITYTKAIEILTQAVADGKVFEEPKIEWGMDLGSEHERYLCEEVFKKPTFVTHYPQELKSFYMKADSGCEPGRETCQAVDLLVPGIGELCGGSMREDNPDKLMAVMAKKGMGTEGLEWYIDLRRDGGLPTGGFGLGFARFVSFLTDAGHIKHVVPFPKAYV